MCEPKVCSANRKLIFGFIFGSASSDGEVTGDFQEDFGGNPVALQSQSDKVVLARKNVFFFYLVLLCGAGLVINEAAAELFYTRAESRKRRVNGKGTKEKEDNLYVDDSCRRLSSPRSFPLPFTLCFLRTKYIFSGFLTTPCEGEIAMPGFVIAWSSELENILEKTKSTL